MTLASTLNVPGHNQAIEAARTVERVVGNAWATDSAGGIIYMTESMLSLVGFSLDQFNEPAGAGTRGWSKLIHQMIMLILPPLGFAAWRQANATPSSIVS